MLTKYPSAHFTPQQMRWMLPFSCIMQCEAKFWVQLYNWSFLHECTEIEAERRGPWGNENPWAHMHTTPVHCLSIYVLYWFGAGLLFVRFCPAMLQMYLFYTLLIVCCCLCFCIPIFHVELSQWCFVCFEHVEKCVMCSLFNDSMKPNHTKHHSH